MEYPMTAPEMHVPRLAEMKDFSELVNIVSAKVGLLPHWIRKDYWVVRVLDAVAREPELGSRFVFKGGTSLSKAWKLIDRFSEDVDLLLTGVAFGPYPEAKGERRRVFKALQAAIEKWTPLYLPLRGLSQGEKAEYYFRSDAHGYMRFPIPVVDGRKDFVKVEAGFRGGSRPYTPVTIQSHLGEYLSRDAKYSDFARDFADDVAGVQVPVLAPSRTFVEKILAVHSAATGNLSALQGRHFYDVAQLFEKHPDVKNCLETPRDFQELLSEAIDVSNRHYGAKLAIDTIELVDSPALLPSGEVLRELAARWRTEESLYPHGQPELNDVLRVIGEIREAIRSAIQG
jgi:hypothetical protein